MISVLFEQQRFPEEYRLDIEIVYSAEGDLLSSDIVLESLTDLIKDEILDNKEYICDGSDFKDFSIGDASFDDSNGIISYEVSFPKMIIGKYFVSKVKFVLNDFETIIHYNGGEIPVIVEDVLPMLRYIG